MATTRLHFCVKILKILTLWPINEIAHNNKRLVKDTWLIVSLMPSTLPIVIDFAMHFYENKYDLSEIMDNLIALSCITGMIYMTILFIMKRKLIVQLVFTINKFKKYGGFDILRDTDKTANFYAKLFIFYGMTGNMVYLLAPYSNTKACEEKNMEQNETDRMPCGLIARCRLPFRFDYSPVFEMVLFHQFYTCITVTLVILVLTMLLCGLLMYVINLLTHLRMLIIKSKENSLNLQGDLHHCVKYHIAIITYSDNINEAFSGMMMFHLTLTSIVISGLVFQILIADTLNNALRFSFHLFGWMVLLLLVCYYGQRLIDESTEIAYAMYMIPWFKARVNIQKDIYLVLMRSQKPLTLNAANVGVMSLPTFLRVISSAYSYSTLLWKFRS